MVPQEGGAINEGAIQEGVEGLHEAIAARILECCFYIVQAFKIRDRFSHIEMFDR
jgi:hypothetical protein